MPVTRIQLSLTEDDARLIDAAAAHVGTSRSKFFLDAAVSRIAALVIEDLLHPNRWRVDPNAHRKELRLSEFEVAMWEADGDLIPLRVREAVEDRAKDLLDKCPNLEEVRVILQWTGNRYDKFCVFSRGK